MINFNVEVSKLKEVLTISKKVVKGNNSQSILSCVRLQNNNQTNNLLLTATNLKTNLIFDIKAQMISNFDFSVEIDKLTKVVSNTDEMILEFYHNVLDNKLVITGYNTKEKYTLKTLNSENYPNIDNIVSKDITIRTWQLQENLKNSLPCVSDDETRYFLGGIFFELVQDKLNLVATDGRRLTFASLDLFNSDSTPFEKIIAPLGLNICASLKNLDEIIKINHNDEFLQLTVEKRDYVLKIQNTIINGTFPQYQRITDNLGYNNDLYIEKKELLKTTKKLKNFVNKRTNKISFMGDNNKLSINAIDDDSSLSIEINDNITLHNNVHLNLSFLTDIVKTTNSENIQIFLNDGTKPLVIKHDSNITMIQPMYE